MKYYVDLRTMELEDEITLNVNFLAPELYYEFGETGVFLKKNNKRNCDNKSKHESQMVIALYPQGLLHRYL